MIFPVASPLPPFPEPGQAPAGELGFAVPGLRLRYCRDADLPFLRELYRETRAAELDAAGWPEALKQSFCRQQFDAQHADYVRRYSAAAFLLLLDGDDPVGRVYLDGSGADFHLIDITLLPSYRGRGYGTAILRGVQDLAVRRGCGVVLSVVPENVRAANLYRRMDFRIVASDAARLHMRWAPPSRS